MGSLATGLIGGFADTAMKKKNKDNGQQKPFSNAKKLLGKMSKKKGPPVGDTTPGSADPAMYKRGGKVRRGGRARVHRGERVLTAKQNRRYERRSKRR